MHRWAWAALLVAGTASADPRWGLTWKAADGCIQAAELAERVERKLGHPVFGAEPDLRIDGYLTAADGSPKGARWRSRLTLVDASGTVQGSREVTSADASCRAIDDSLVLVMAVMIDPKAALTPFAAPTEPPPPPPPPSPEPLPAGPPVDATPPAPNVPLQPTRPLLPPGPPPARMELVHGVVYLGYQQLDHGEFYLMVHREDLRRALTTRAGTRIFGITFGFISLSAGAILLAAHALNVDCVRYAGTPSSGGACLQSSDWALWSGVGVGAFGLASLGVGFGVPSHPTNEEEDQRLINEYNSSLQQLQQKAAPATVRLELLPVPAGLGLALAGSFAGP